MDPELPGGVSTMIFTLDEEENLPACLDSLRWCDDVVVIDSGSRDATAEICARRGVRFCEHAFTGFGSQRNWALDNVDTRHPWVLILDADERVPEALAGEMCARVRAAGEGVGAFRLRRRFHLWGRWLRHSSLYPSWVVRLVHRERVRFADRGHAETQQVQGRIEALAHDLIDENRKGLEHWFARHNRYARREAEYELAEAAQPGAPRDLLSADPLRRRAALKRLVRRLPLRPSAYFLYSYVLRGGFLDGREGFLLCTMKATYQRMIVLHRHELAKRRGR